MDCKGQYIVIDEKTVQCLCLQNEGSKPVIPLNKPSFTKKPAATVPNGVSNITKSIGNQLNNNLPAISLAQLKERKKSLKGQDSPIKKELPPPEPDDSESEEVFTDSTANKRYKKAKFIKKPTKPKPASIEAVTLPIIQFKDENGVELRIGAGREDVESGGSLM